MTEVLTDAQIKFELMVTRITNRRSALVGKRTTAERRELMRTLILEHHLADEIAPMQGEEQISYANWFRAIYRKAAHRGIANA